MSKYELVVLFAVFLGVGVPALMFMFLSRSVSSSPLLLFLSGLLLVLLGAHGFDLLISLENPIEKLAPNGDITKETILRLEHQRQLWLLLFPTVASAIGVNLMSSAIIQRPSSIPELDAATERLEVTAKRIENATRSQYIVLSVLIAIIGALLIYSLLN
jgi:hypothetical protein